MEENVKTYPVVYKEGVVPHISSMAEYHKQYKLSIEQPEKYWDEVASTSLKWFRKYDSVLEGILQEGNIRWFEGGLINASYNCLDRHLKTKGDQTAIIWDRDEPGQEIRYSYKQAHAEVCRLANVLHFMGIKKGDRVAIYMPMVPHAAFAMLACARIGAIHSVVFGGFSAEALRARIQDAQCKLVITANAGLRGGRSIELKKTVDQALLGCECVEKVLVYRHPAHENKQVHMQPGRDVWLNEAMEEQRPYCSAEQVDSEHPLFMLYTSGSTGKPKGVIHTTGGYLVYGMHTTKLIWDLHDGDIFSCVADVGWITGHTYVVYGPLLNGVTTVMFESLPNYPNPGRYWEMAQRLKITHLYTAPTAIRTLMSYGNEHVQKWDRSSIRILGSVGEPLNPEAWRWYYNICGEGKCPVVDSWWQTETGGIAIAALPGAIPTKPGSTALPFFGQKPVLVEAETGTPIPDGTYGKGLLLLQQPWPSIARTVYGDHKRYMETYLKSYPGYYFTGDGCERDHEGYIYITGRVDDVINKCGHRLGTAEIESALVLHDACAEAAVVAIPHDIRGESIVAFVILSQGWSKSPDLMEDLKLQVRKQIGGIAVPDWLIIVPGLPKTRSGKIMRRILRKIASNEADQLGDTSTLSDPDIVEVLISLVKDAMNHNNA